MLETMTNTALDFLLFGAVFSVPVFIGIALQCFVSLVSHTKL